MNFPGESLLTSLTTKLLTLKSEVDYLALSYVEALHAHYYQIKCLIYAITTNFKTYAIQNWQDLLLSMNTLDLNMHEFLVSYYLAYKQNYTLYDKCNCTHHCSTLHSCCCFCFFWVCCSKKVHVDSSFESIRMFDLFELYTRIVVYYRVISGDIAIQTAFEIIEELEESENDIKIKFKSYVEYKCKAPQIKQLKDTEGKNDNYKFWMNLMNDSFVEAYLILETLEFYVKENAKIERIDDMIDFKLLNNENFHILKLLELQTEILNTRANWYSLDMITFEIEDTSHKVIVKIPKNNSELLFMDADLDYSFVKKFDIKLIRLRQYLYKSSRNANFVYNQNGKIEIKEL